VRIQDPLVSIVIPVKNGMPYLKKCVESVIKSSYKNLEIIVSDDGSVDGSRDYILSLNHDAIKLISPAKPMGIGNHWTFVSSFATGAYLKLLCSDDTVNQPGIENQVRALQSNSEIGMVASRREFIDHEGRKIFNSKKFSGIPLELAGKEAVRKSLLQGTNIFGEPSSVMFRNSVLKEYLPWNDSEPYLLDFELYARLLLESNKRIVLLPSLDATFRIHGVSLSSAIQSESRDSIPKLAKKLGPKLSFSRFEMIQIKLMSYLKAIVRSAIFSTLEWLKKFPKLSQVSEKKAPTEIEER
jgi:glycosyltransferase involved in cell wall biosynthesis